MSERVESYKALLILWLRPFRRFRNGSESEPCVSTNVCQQDRKVFLATSQQCFTRLVVSVIWIHHLFSTRIRNIFRRATQREGILMRSISNANLACLYKSKVLIQKPFPFGRPWPKAFNKNILMKRHSACLQTACLYRPNKSGWEINSAQWCLKIICSLGDDWMVTDGERRKLKSDRVSWIKERASC